METISKLIMQGKFNGYKYIITEDITGTTNKSLTYNQIKILKSI